MAEPPEPQPVETTVGQYHISQAARLLGVSPDTVRRWADGGRLNATRDHSGQRVIDGAELARFASTLSYTGELGATTGHSARNRFIGIVTKVTKDTVMAQVEIQAGPFRVVSLISREATDELALAPGVLVVASVKATNVTVELPAAGV